jgi:hypothetical protein
MDFKELKENVKNVKVKMLTVQHTKQILVSVKIVNKVFLHLMVNVYLHVLLKVILHMLIKLSKVNV